MKTSYYKNIKITDCDNAPQLTNNILEFDDPNIFRYSRELEIKIQSYIIQYRIQGYNDDEIYEKVLGWMKKTFKPWTEKEQYKFDVHYVRYAQPNANLTDSPY